MYVFNQNIVRFETLQHPIANCEVKIFSDMDYKFLQVFQKILFRPAYTDAQAAGSRYSARICEAREQEIPCARKKFAKVKLGNSITR